MRIKRITGLIIATILMLILSSHDLFLKTDQYFVPANTEQELFLFNGTFEKSENPITRDRIVSPVIIGPEYKFVPDENDWFDRENITYMKYKSGAAGTYVAGVSTLSRSIELTADEFNEYLEHDGILDILRERKENGELSNNENELYAKHVKAIIQVGDSYSDECLKELGYPLEFVPQNNPYASGNGEKLGFLLLKDGKPLPNHLVYYRVTGGEFHGHDHSREVQLRTDEKGRFEITADHDGIWYLRTIHMVKSDGTSFSYRSNWATLSFATGKNE